MKEEQKMIDVAEDADWKNLGDVVVKKTMKATPQEFPEAKFIGMDCIEPHSLRPSFLYDFKDFKSSGNYFKKNEVLYGRMRPYLNKVFKAEFDGTCSGEFIVLECKPELMPDYLKYALHSREFVSFANAKTSGDRPRISFDEIAEYILRVPSIKDQQQIASKIEELFSELDKGIEELKTAQQQLKVYRQAVLKWTFEGRLTNEDVKDGELPHTWKRVRIEHLLSDKKRGMSTGPFGTMLKKHEHRKEGVPVLGIENIGEGIFQMPNKIFVSSQKADELKNFKVDANDVIISRSGTVGEICLVPSKMKDAIISTNLIKVSLDKKVIDPKYFVYLFQGGHVRQQVFSLCKGSSRAFLNQTILSSIDFPYCSIEEQQQIIQEIESRLSVCDKIEETITDSLKQAEALRQSILKRAFEGKLF